MIQVLLRDHDPQSSEYRGQGLQRPGLLCDAPPCHGHRQHRSHSRERCSVAPGKHERQLTIDMGGIIGVRISSF